MGIELNAEGRTYFEIVLDLQNIRRDRRFERMSADVGSVRRYIPDRWEGPSKSCKAPKLGRR